MKIGVRILLGLLVVVVLVVGLERYAAESGEVVVMTALDVEGQPATTRLWVVDHDGSQWLRVGADGSGWFRRMHAADAVEVTRHGQTGRYIFAVEPESSDAINSAMAAKYGWADSFIAMLFGNRDGSQPIRLIPANR